MPPRSTSKVETPGQADAHKAGHALAQNARTLRKARGMNLDELARVSGLSTSTLSKIENQQISPTFDTLVALASGLQIGVGGLLAQSPDGKAIGRRTINRAGEGTHHPTDVYDYTFLCTEIRNKKFTPILTEIKADDVAEFPELSSHEGEEFFYVISGEVTLHTDLYEPVSMAAGDSAYFDSTMGHALVRAKQDTRVLWVSSSFDRIAGKDA